MNELCILVVNDSITQTTLLEYLEVFEGGMFALRLISEFQTVELSDVGDVHVPIALSYQIESVLFEICTKLSNASVGHLLTKKIRKHMSEHIASKFEELIGEKISGEWNLPTRTTLQILFDVQVLATLFNSEKLRKLASSIESHLDPFDVSLLSPLLSANVKLSHARSQVLFSSLITETISNKDVQLPPSYSKIQDLVVHIEQPSRIPMIPRLDRAADRTENNKKSGNSKAKNNRYLANPNQQGSSKSTPSLSAFYDRISSSWFGGANN
ncbi:unnamed protein product [Caenorhabditis angaria]|uniref:Conserved oligomeric Golgi complex subunit 1 n=1 Tax=Caenorhabditis angaria TaxID=860376 RepID=A0A9P1I684_9PELO|nr:unnamed protein product [Caenorhabditis angaria]